MSKKIVCQLYLPSFGRSYGKNSLREIFVLLPYLKKAGFSGVYLIALWESGCYDNGFDVVDYKIDPAYGVETTLKLIVDRCHQLGMEIGLDVIPNHVSDKHELAQKCLEGISGYEDVLYVVSKEEAERLTKAGVPSFFGSKPYSDFGDKYVRTTFCDYRQLNLNWHSSVVQRYFRELFSKLQGMGIDFARVDCAGLLLEDVSKADSSNPLAVYDFGRSVQALRAVNGDMRLFCEWFDPGSAAIFENMPEAYALDCSYVLTGQQNTEWHHRKLVPLIGGHDQMTLSDRGLRYDDILRKIESSECEYAFSDLQSVTGHHTDPEIKPEDKLFDADVNNPNQRYRARRPIHDVIRVFKDFYS